MKFSLHIVLILHLLLSSVFSVQAETHDEYAMQEMQNCSCENSVEMSVNQCCSTASLLYFNLQPLSYLTDASEFILTSFTDYKNRPLSQHAARIFRPPIIHSVI